MPIRPFLAAAALCFLAARAAAIDTIKTAKQSMSGTVQEIGKYEVTLKRTGDKIEKVPVNEIEALRLEGEPPKLNLIRNAIDAGRYEDAGKDLSELPADASARAEVKQEIEYLKALAAAKLALTNWDPKLIAPAVTQLTAFVKSHGSSWRFLAATELLGDLLLASSQPAAALPHYAVLEQAPWPDVKMRGAVCKGRALAAEKKFDDALAAYGAALSAAAGASGPAVEAQHQAAEIGKAGCLAETGKHAEGIALLQDVIAKADPEQAELHALAYNVLGACQRKAGNSKAALLAYLHVDILYNTVPAAHAEALANLKELWRESGNADRAAAADSVLQDRYKNSKWAKQ